MTVARRKLLWMAWGGVVSAHADEPPLHVLIDGSIGMPQALFKAGQAVDGLQVDLALALGQRLGRAVHFRQVPRRRVSQMLNDGREADLICNYLPAWLPGPLQWSRPYLDDADLLVTAAQYPAPAHLQDLAGQRIGTVAGYLYPQAEAILGASFLRDDAPNVVASLRKLASGRIQHAIVGRVTLGYLQRRGEVPLALHPPLVIARLRTACALAPHSSLPLARLDATLSAMQADGSLARLFDKYR